MSCCISETIPAYCIKLFYTRQRAYHALMAQLFILTSAQLVTSKQKAGYIVQSGALLRQVTFKITYISNVENEAILKITYISNFSKYYFYR